MSWIELLSMSVRNLPVDDSRREDVDALYTFHAAVHHALTDCARQNNSERQSDGFRLLAESLHSGNHDRALRFPVDPDIALSGFEAAENIGGSGGALAPMCERAAQILDGQTPEDESALRAFLDDWSGETALLIARAMGVRGSWQRAGVLSAARAHTLSKHICQLERDAATGFILFPTTDLERYGVQPDDLGTSSSTGELDRLVWKQIIRIQQALSGVVDLVADLDNKPARRVRRWWFTIIELTHAIEKLDYDPGQLPIGPTRFQRAQIIFQSLFGRTTFRA